MLPAEASLAAPKQGYTKASGSDLIVSAKTSRRETAALVFEAAGKDYVPRYPGYDPDGIAEARLTIFILVVTIGIA
jgi:hypothetical protein